MSDRVLWEDTGDKRVWFIRDGDNMIIETEWNVDAVLDANKSAQADFSKTTKQSELVQVATIPTGMYWDWYRQGIVNDDEAFKRRLNDSDFRHVRTNSLRV